LSYPDDAISPVDGRYYKETKEARNYFSESALIRARVHVEKEYLLFLIRRGIAPDTDLPEFDTSVERVKKIEKKVGHDVKAVELYIKEELEKHGKEELKLFVHLGLTSEDVNSIAYALIIKRFLKEILIPQYRKMIYCLVDIAEREARSLMPARTHGMPAVPTTFGKEIAVFAVRLADRLAELSELKPAAKCSGAAGTYASFKLLKDDDWVSLLRDFVESFGLDSLAYTTQIAPYDRLSDILHYIISINQIMLSLARDLWMYQMLNYVKVRSYKSQIGSSTMPQKENPSELENAEGQCEISNSLLMLIAYRLEVNRLQRDLSDSTIRRMLGQALAHSLLASRRISGSLGRLEVKREVMREDALKNKEIIAESAQITIKMKKMQDGYETLFHAFREERKEEVEKLLERYGKGIEDYVGYAPDLARNCRKEVEKRLLLNHN
jgi:adenylosuccinate lyase